MANVLPAERRLEVSAALVNGTSIRAAERITGVHRDTIGRFAQAMGEGCARLHDRLVRDLTCPLVDLDEQHSWCQVRQKQFDPAKHSAAEMGEQWTWAAICRTSKLVIAWHVGKRDQESADALVDDVRARLVMMPQLTTDGLGLYAQPIAANFGPAVPYMQTVKNFSARPGKPGVSEKYAVPRGVDFIQKRAVFGAPDPAKATNYAIERSNLTARQWNARLRRRTLAFSKKLSRHCAAVALHYVYTNLCHIPRNMRVTPGMAAGITDTVWTLEMLMVAALAEPAGEKPSRSRSPFRSPRGRRGSYRAGVAGSGCYRAGPSRRRPWRRSRRPWRPSRLSRSRSPRHRQSRRPRRGRVGWCSCRCSSSPGTAFRALTPSRTLVTTEGWTASDPPTCHQMWRRLDIDERPNDHESVQNSSIAMAFN